MELYKIIIKPLSSYTSLLQSDTFFGAFCWSYKYLYGENRLEQFLRENIESGPKLIFSNAFPSGFLPLPMGSYDSERENYLTSEKGIARKAYQDNKKLKKCTLVARESFREIQIGNRSGYSKDLCEEQTLQIETTHNMVGRDTGTVRKSDDRSGNLFVRNEFFPNSDSFFDVYILSDLDPLLMTNVLTLMFDLGIGASKSTGKGHFKMVPDKNGDFLLKERELDKVASANGYVALSDFIPDTRDPVHGWYRTFVKFGKLDREYAASEYPYKKPLLFIQPGAVFQTERVQPYYGKIMTNVSAIDGVVVNACTIAVPIYIPEEIQR